MASKMRKNGDQMVTKSDGVCVRRQGSVPTIAPAAELATLEREMGDVIDTYVRPCPRLLRFENATVVARAL